ncbi:hypothetical protein A6R68_11903, partial [Neotoma lepida]
MEMKPGPSGQGQKRKHQEEGGTEIESAALRQDKKPKCQDEGGPDLQFEEPSKTRKRIPQEHQDLELQSQQLRKDEVQKAQHDNPRQLKLLGGSSRSLPNKIAEVREEKKPVVDQEKGGGMEEVLDVTEDMENEIKRHWVQGPKKK